jgi:hypothetical protein
VKGRRGRRYKQLLGDLKKTRGYWKLKEKALDRTLWRTCCGRGYGPVVRQTRKWVKLNPFWWWTGTFVYSVVFMWLTNSLCHFRLYFFTRVWGRIIRLL